MADLKPVPVITKSLLNGVGQRPVLAGIKDIQGAKDNHTRKCNLLRQRLGYQAELCGTFWIREGHYLVFNKGPPVLLKKLSSP